MQIDSIISNRTNYKSNFAKQKIKHAGKNEYKALTHSQHNDNKENLLILSLATIISFLPATIINISDFLKVTITNIAKSIHKKLQN